MPKEKVKHTRQETRGVIERKRWKEGNVLWSLLVGLIVVLIELIAVAFFGLSGAGASLLGVILVLVYSVILFFLLEPHILREIRHTQIKTVEKPVIRTVEKPVIRIKTVEKPVEKRVYVPVMQKRKKLNIPKYEYFGSDETKTYHHRNCRFRKLIKRKHQEHSNSASYFTRRKYVPCKMCIAKRSKKKSVSKKN